jgi:hypothetical protein
MQRETPEGIILACDFCRRDWDGQEAMIEGHHGSIICLECLKRALAECKTAEGGEKYKCTMCLRFNIPGTLAQWRFPENPDAVICRDCIAQSAGTFSKSPHTDWKWDRKIAT